MGIAAAVTGVLVGPGRFLPTDPPDVLPPEPPEGSPYACLVDPLTEGVELELLTAGPSDPGRPILEERSRFIANGPTRPEWIIDEAGYFWIVSRYHVPDRMHGLIGRVPRSVVDDMRARMTSAGRELIQDPPREGVARHLGKSATVTIDVGPPGTEDRILLCEKGRHHASPEAWRILRWFTALQNMAYEHPMIVARRQWPRPESDPEMVEIRKLFDLP
jgi:hypothetical protein